MNTPKRVTEVIMCCCGDCAYYKIVQRATEIEFCTRYPAWQPIKLITPLRPDYVDGHAQQYATIHSCGEFKPR